MNPKVIFGPYEPDKPPHLHEGLTDLANVYPSSNGYRPVGALNPITPAIPGRFNSGAAYVASDGTASLIAGTASSLYRYSGGVWTEIASGLSGTEAWAFTQFGDLAIAVNGGTTMAVDLLTASAAPLGGSPPTATSVATVRDYVLYGQAGGEQNLVQWSGFNDATSNDPGVNQAGFQPMLEGGAVMGVVGGEYGIVIQRRRVVRVSATGDEFVFQFDPISDEIGAISEGSIAKSGRMIFFLSDKGFMRCDGNEVVPIGLERVDRTFFAMHPRSTLNQMVSAIDPRQNIVAWLMPGNPGRMWIYNWGIDRWAKLEIAAKGMFSGFTANITLEALDALYPGGLETIPYSLDDERWAGGDPLFLLVDQQDQICTLSGPNMAASITTPFVELIDRRRTRLRAVAPIGDMTSGVSIILDSRQRLGDRASEKKRSVMQASGLMPVRSNGLFIESRLEFDAGAQWTFAQGLEFFPAMGGAR
ncbi:MAG: hypothetical protein ABS87_01010 [Sphingomonas sp. SCN 67-18]|nr:hypothetical protein [Sphingomonas sp. SCN 67-18]ODU22778.1 MAG: hypothetical protein ABS87_01010 [Sphingomonas sp. SCN 67-18]